MESVKEVIELRPKRWSAKKKAQVVLRLPLTEELDRAKKRIGELSMENELLYERCRNKGPFVKGRSRR